MSRPVPFRVPDFAQHRLGPRASRGLRGRIKCRRQVDLARSLMLGHLRWRDRESTACSKARTCCAPPKHAASSAAKRPARRRHLARARRRHRRIARAADVLDLGNADTCTRLLMAWSPPIRGDLLHRDASLRSRPMNASPFPCA